MDDALVLGVGCIAYRRLGDGELLRPQKSRSGRRFDDRFNDQQLGWLVAVMVRRTVQVFAGRNESFCACAGNLDVTHDLPGLSLGFIPRILAAVHSGKPLDAESP